MGKRVILIIVATWAIFNNSHGDNNMKKTIVNNLKDTISFDRSSNTARKELDSVANENIIFFKKTRIDKISRVVSFYHIESINAIIEWGGGIDKRYCVVIFSTDAIYWLTWVGDDEAIGKIPIKNDKLRNSLKNKFENLSKYTGESVKTGSERIILFMTLYENNIPQKTFCSDFPNDVVNESKNYSYKEVGDIIKEAKKMIRETINVFLD